MTPPDDDERRDEQADENEARLDLLIQVVDVPTPGLAGLRLNKSRVSIVLLLFLVPAALVVGVTIRLNLNPVLGLILMLGFLFPMALLVNIWFGPKREAPSKTIERLGPQEAILESMNQPVAFSVHKGISSTVGAVAAHGERGVLYRFLPSSELGRIEPIRVPFEPAALDESDARVAELMSATSPEMNLTPATSLRRNVRRAGGWLIVGIFAFNVVLHLFRSIMIRRVTWELMWWSGIFLIMFFGVGQSWRLPTFLAVPGGIVSRKLRGIGRESSVRLYTAADSVLCAYRATKILWVLSVADGESAQWTACTPAEARFAMAAWVSTIASPTLEQLAEI